MTATGRPDTALRTHPAVRAETRMAFADFSATGLRVRAYAGPLATTARRLLVAERVRERLVSEHRHTDPAANAGRRRAPEESAQPAGTASSPTTYPRFGMRS